MAKIETTSAEDFFDKLEAIFEKRNPDYLDYLANVRRSWDNGAFTEKQARWVANNSNIHKVELCASLKNELTAFDVDLKDPYGKFAAKKQPSPIPFPQPSPLARQLNLKPFDTSTVVANGNRTVGQLGRDCLPEIKDPENAALMEALVRAIDALNKSMDVLAKVIKKDGE